MLNTELLVVTAFEFSLSYPSIRILPVLCLRVVRSPPPIYWALSQIQNMSNASRSDIITTLRNLQDNPDIQKGDNLLLFYAGHGSHCVSGSTKVNAICPINRGINARDITMPELESIFSELQSAKGNSITAIFDCCHSGDTSGSRRSGEGPDEVRYLPPLLLEGVDKTLTSMDQSRRSCNPSEDNLGSQNVVWLAACRWQENAKERWMTVEGGTVRQSHGLFTAALVTTLESENGKTATYEKVIEIMGHLRTSQTPEAVGSGTKSQLWYRDAPW